MWKRKCIFVGVCVCARAVYSVAARSSCARKVIKSEKKRKEYAFACLSSFSHSNCEEQKNNWNDEQENEIWWNSRLRSNRTARIEVMWINWECWLLGESVRDEIGREEKICQKNLFRACTIPTCFARATTCHHNLFDSRILSGCSNLLLALFSLHLLHPLLSSHIKSIKRTRRMYGKHWMNFHSIHKHTDNCWHRYFHPTYSHTNVCRSLAHHPPPYGWSQRNIHLCVIG